MIYFPLGNPTIAVQLWAGGSGPSPTTLNDHLLFYTFCESQDKNCSFLVGIPLISKYSCATMDMDSLICLGKQQGGYHS